jgi:hypothetical protein
VKYKAKQRLYFGAACDRQFNGMYSKELTIDKIKEFREKIRKICREQGCVEATRFDMPKVMTFP